MSILGQKTKNPSLPCLFLFKYSNGALEYQDTFYYQFYRWEDFATYLGNYHDNGNDFYFTEKIKFSVGISVDEEILRNNAILVLLKRENTISRSEERFGNPPVKYSEDGCLTPDNYSLDANWLDHYEVVTITNKEKLK